MKLKCLDEVIPIAEEGSAAFNLQNEQLWRNEFFRDCLAPVEAEFKVRLKNLHLIYIGCLLQAIERFGMCAVCVQKCCSSNQT